MPTDELKDVPVDKVGKKVQQLVKSEGVTKIECILQSNSLWTISVAYES